VVPSVLMLLCVVVAAAVVVAVVVVMHRLPSRTPAIRDKSVSDIEQSQVSVKRFPKVPHRYVCANCTGCEDAYVSCYYVSKS
jgi:hypothetical protein